jgi:hypothetical protein
MSLCLTQSISFVVDTMPCRSTTMFDVNSVANQRIDEQRASVQMIESIFAFDLIVL